jgi:hypothetical protein
MANDDKHDNRDTPGDRNLPEDCRSWYIFAVPVVIFLSDHASEENPWK